MDQLYEMARTVVVVSSQLITTLSALAYLRNRNINGTDLRVLSLERLDHVHAAHPFEDVLIRLAARDGHRCVFGELSALPAEPEGLICVFCCCQGLITSKGGKCCSVVCQML